MTLVLDLEALIYQHLLPRIWPDVALAMIYSEKCTGVDFMLASTSLSAGSLQLLFEERSAWSFDKRKTYLLLRSERLEKLLGYWTADVSEAFARGTMFSNRL
jgi:hypothetical protein